jgi:hypothetical protein
LYRKKRGTERVSESRARRKKMRFMLFNARFEIYYSPIDYAVNGPRTESLGKTMNCYRSGYYTH